MAVCHQGGPELDPIAIHMAMGWIMSEDVVFSSIITLILHAFHSATIPCNFNFSISYLRKTKHLSVYVYCFMFMVPCIADRY